LAGDFDGLIAHRREAPDRAVPARRMSRIKTLPAKESSDSRSR
jgi:hypothetical protein